MRDLRKYPITRKEIRKTLTDEAADLMSYVIFGDIRPAALMDALEQLEVYWNLQDERI